MDIYEKIDAIFSEEDENKPQWASEILTELKEIKALLATKHTHPSPKAYTGEAQSIYYDWVKNFRKRMKAKPSEDIYPSFDYQGRTLGIDFKGLLYDKKSAQIISKQEAFKIYKFAYNQSKSTQNSA